MFKEKYTMKEFEEMFLDAQKETIEELDKQMKEKIKDEDEGFGTVIFTMQNLMATGLLYNKLFNKEKEGE